MGGGAGGQIVILSEGRRHRGLRQQGYGTKTAAGTEET